MWRTAIRFMKYDKPKSIGIITGIVISIFLIGQQMSTLFFLTDLMGALVTHSNSRDNDIWVVDELTTNINAVNPIDIRYAQQIRSIEGVENTFPVVLAQSKATLKDGKTQSVLLIGSSGPEFVAGPRQDVITKGNINNLNNNDGVSVEYFNVKTWKTNMGFGDRLEINGKEATIKLETKYAQGYGGQFVYTSIDNARFYSGFDDTKVSAVVVRPKPGADVQQICDHINRSFMGVTARTADELRRLTINEILVATNTGTSFGSLVIFAIISGFFIIGLTLYSAVLDRLKDYGTLKAIGATNGYVNKLILLQAFLFAIIGFVISYGLLKLFQSGVEKAGMILHIDLPLTIGLILVTLFISVGGSLFALRKINKLEPASVF